MLICTLCPKEARNIPGMLSHFRYHHPGKRLPKEFPGTAEKRRVKQSAAANGNGYNGLAARLNGASNHDGIEDIPEPEEAIVPASEASSLDPRISEDAQHESSFDAAISEETKQVMYSAHIATQVEPAIRQAAQTLGVKASDMLRVVGHYLITIAPLVAE